MHFERTKLELWERKAQQNRQHSCSTKYQVPGITCKKNPNRTDKKKSKRVQRSRISQQDLATGRKSTRNDWTTRKPATDETIDGEIHFLFAAVDNATQSIATGRHHPTPTPPWPLHSVPPPFCGRGREKKRQFLLEMSLSVRWVRRPDGPITFHRTSPLLLLLPLLPTLSLPHLPPGCGPL